MSAMSEKIAIEIADVIRLMGGKADVFPSKRCKNGHTVRFSDIDLPETVQRAIFNRVAIRHGGTPDLEKKGA